MGRLGLCRQSVNLLCIIGNLNTDIWRYGGSRVWGWVVQVRGRGRLWVVCGFVCICYRDIYRLPICQDLGVLAIFSAVVPHMHSADWVLSGWGSVVNTFSSIPAVLVFLVLSGYYVSLCFLIIFILFSFIIILFSVVYLVIIIPIVTSSASPNSAPTNSIKFHSSSKGSPSISFECCLISVSMLQRSFEFFIAIVFVVSSIRCTLLSLPVLGPCWLV